MPASHARLGLGDGVSVAEDGGSIEANQIIEGEARCPFRQRLDMQPNGSFAHGTTFANRYKSRKSGRKDLNLRPSGPKTEYRWQTPAKQPRNRRYSGGRVKWTWYRETW